MRGEAIRRRDFITLLAGAAIAWPSAARAQQNNPMRRIGVLMNLAADDPEGPPRDAAFRQGLQELGWTEGGNLRIEYRWGAGDADRIRRYATELVALAPEVILASSGPIVAALRLASSTVPIVFTATIDPVATGYVASLARPGGSATGFGSTTYGVTQKLLELVKQIAPSATRAAVIGDPTIISGIDQFQAVEVVASSLGVELSTVDVRSPSEIERGVMAFAHTPNGGLIVPQNTLAVIHRKLIINLAARYRLPAAYSNRLFATAGGLISYGPVTTDLYRRAAGYVDRILKGAKPADLPVQMPTKYELVINLKTASTLGLVVPRQLLAGADELIE